MSHPHAEVRQIKRHRPEDTHLGYYFVVKAANGETVATSEIYTRAEDAERGASDLIEAMSHEDFTVTHAD